jgi:hypothetical protein
MFNNTAISGQLRGTEGFHLREGEFDSRMAKLGAQLSAPAAMNVRFWDTQLMVR